jgi:hypothetical protein
MSGVWLSDDHARPVAAAEDAVRKKPSVPTDSTAGVDAAVADISEPFAVSVLLGIAALAVA